MYQFNKSRRRGAVVILVAVFMVALIGMAAIVVDLAYIALVKAETQNAADAAAHAALIAQMDPTDPDVRNLLKGTPTPNDVLQASRDRAAAVAALHKAGNVSVSVVGDATNSSAEDVISGRFLAPQDHSLLVSGEVNETTGEEMVFNPAWPLRVSPPFPYFVPAVTTPSPVTPPPGLEDMIVLATTQEPPEPLDFYYGTAVTGVRSLLDAPPVIADFHDYDSVRINVHRDDIRNGRLTLFFSRIFGVSDMPLAATATASHEGNIKGFRVYPGIESWNPEGTITSKLMPFALDVNTFGAVGAGLSVIDLYTYDRLEWPGSSYAQRVTLTGIDLDQLTDLENSDFYKYISPVTMPNMGVSVNDLPTDPLDPFFVVKVLNALNTNSNLNGLLTYRPDLNPEFNPYNPAAYEALTPGDDIKEGLMIPLTIRRNDPITDPGQPGLPPPVAEIAPPPYIPPLPVNVPDPLNPQQHVHTGNFGTLQIGTLAANVLGTDFARQVREGPNAADFATIGGEFRLGVHPGDTIVPQALKEVLEDIVGHTRIMPLYEPNTTTLLPQLTDQVNGTAANFNIVAFGGMTILKVLQVPSVEFDDVNDPPTDPMTGQQQLVETVDEDNDQEIDRVIIYRVPITAARNTLATALNQAPLNILLNQDQKDRILGLYDSILNAVGTERTVKVFFQPEFVFAPSAIGAASRADVNTSRFIYRPAAITR